MLESSSVSGAFSDFEARLSIPKTKQDFVEARRQEVTGKLSSELEFSENFLAGSYKCFTQLAPLWEINFYLVLAPKHASQFFSNVPVETVIFALKKMLEPAFPGRVVRTRENGVNIRFEDFGFDLSAVFQRKGGGYLVADTSKNKWVRIEPKSYVDFFQAADKRCGNRLSTCVKMLKCWNNNNGNLLRQIHLEVLAAKIFDAIIDNYPLSILAFFTKAEKLVSVPCSDPNIPEVQIDEYLGDANKLRVKSLLISAAQNAQKAINLQNSGFEKEALVIWKLLFGTGF